MRRALAIVLVAVMAGMLSGVESASQILSDGDGLTEQQRRQVIASQLNGVMTGHVVRVEDTTGRRYKAVFVQATPDAITFVRLGEAPIQSESRLLEEIERVEQEGRRIVRIAHVDGRTFNVALVSATAEALTISFVEEEGEEERILLADILELDEPGWSVLKRIAVGAGIFAGVCAAIAISIASSL